MAQSTLKDCIQYLYQKAKEKAHFKNRVFDIPFPRFSKLVQADCFYCGLPADCGQSFKYNEKTFRLNSIERNSPKDDYTTANTTTACLYCNYAKANILGPSFVAWAKRISDRWSNSAPISDSDQTENIIDPLNARMVQKYNFSKRKSYHRDE